MDKLPDVIYEPRFVTTELDTLLSNLLMYVPAQTTTGLVERVERFRTAAKRNGLYLLADPGSETALTNFVEAYEAGRQAGIQESLNNQTHAAFRLGEQQALAKQAKSRETLLDYVHSEIKKQEPTWDSAQINCYINSFNVIEMLVYVGEYYGQRKTD